MKSLVEYIDNELNENKDNVWVVKDKIVDGILDVCETEEDARLALDGHLEENADAKLEIKQCKRSEVEKK